MRWWNSRYFLVSYYPHSNIYMLQHSTTFKCTIKCCMTFGIVLQLPNFILAAFKMFLRILYLSQLTANSLRFDYCFFFLVMKKASKAKIFLCRQKLFSFPYNSGFETGIPCNCLLHLSCNNQKILYLLCLFLEIIFTFSLNFVWGGGIH